MKKEYNKNINVFHFSLQCYHAKFMIVDTKLCFRYVRTSYHYNSKFVLIYFLQKTLVTQLMLSF